MSYRDEVRSGISDGSWTFWQVFWKVLIPLMIVFSVLGFVVKMLSVPAGIIERQVNPDAIVQNYEWYEQQYQDIQASDKQIATAQQAVNRFKEDAGPRKDWRADERSEMSRLNENLDGLNFYRAKLVSEYNAKSRMITRSAWKRSDLPYQIP